MKKFWICCFAAVCMVLSGCAGNQREMQKAEPLEQEEDARLEAQNGTAADLSQAKEPELPAKLDSAPEDDAFSGRWLAVESPQYYMDISNRGGDGYTIEIIWAGASQGNIVWLVTGNYDETWEGVAYVGTKYEDVAQEDGAVDRIPVAEREEVTGMVYLEDDGTLHWIDDFDHAGDGLSFERG